MEKYWRAAILQFSYQKKPFSISIFIPTGYYEILFV